MRPRVQSPFRAQTDRGLWDSSLRICKCLCEHGRQSVRRLARQTGLSQSRVHRLTQAMERRTSSPASWFWESADGRQWLTRLVVATLDPCGLQRGVGRDTLSEFFTRRHLATQVGGAASAFRGVLQALEAAVGETAQTWEQDGIAQGAVGEVIGGVDETCWQRLLLVLQDVPTG